MDPASVQLLIGLISEGVGVAAKISELAKRVEAGDVITDEEIAEARNEVSEAIDGWNKA